jgi:hypothetical protein
VKTPDEKQQEFSVNLPEPVKSAEDAEDYLRDELEPDASIH